MPCYSQNDAFDSNGNPKPGITVNSGPYSSYQDCIDAQCDDCSQAGNCAGNAICCGDGSGSALCMTFDGCDKQIVSIGPGEWLVRPDETILFGSDPGTIGQSVCGSMWINVTGPVMVGGQMAYNIKSCY